MFSDEHRRSRLVVSLVIIIIAVLLAIAGLIAYKTFHLYGDAVRTEPKCRSDGAVYRICSVCGKVDVIEILPAVGHECGEWVLEQVPTVITDGTEVCSCIRCGEQFERPIARLTEQFEKQTPRLDLTANAVGVSTTSSVPVDFVFRFTGEEVTGSFELRYLPPEELTPHDYVMSLGTGRTGSGFDKPQLLLASEGEELYALADHADPLHIRADAVSRLFLDVSAMLSNQYASLLTLPNGIGFFGTRIALYQNGVYLEPRTLCLSPAAYCQAHPAITAAVMCGSDGSLYPLSGDAADSALAAAIAEAEDGNFTQFDTDVLAAYLVFRDAVRLNDALGSGLLWVFADGKWYPLPTCTENCLGADIGAAGLCAADALPTDTGGTVYEAFFESARRTLAPQIVSAREVHMNGALSVTSVENRLRGAADALPAELLTYSRNGVSDALRAKDGSIDDILVWYAERNG